MDLWGKQRGGVRSERSLEKWRVNAIKIHEIFFLKHPDTRLLHFREGLLSSVTQKTKSW